MATYVFCGPSLPPEQLRELMPEATACPPIRRGDLEQRAVAAGDRVLILDGYYFHVPAIQHVEIIEALRRGARVWGAASMGALRAAELAGVGMRGVGYVYGRYASGALREDDEVAILHDPDNYRPFSDAMVNLDYNLRAAVRAGALTSDAASLVLAQLRERWFGERSYALAISLLRSSPYRAQVDALRDHLARSKVDVKRRDALAALRALATSAPAERSRADVSTLPETTVFGAGVQREFAPEEESPELRRTEVLTAWLVCTPRAKRVYRRCAQLELLSLLPQREPAAYPSTDRCHRALVLAGLLSPQSASSAVDAFLYPLQIGSGVRSTRVLETHLARSGALLRTARALEAHARKIGSAATSFQNRPSAAQALGVYAKLWSVAPPALGEEVRQRGFLDMNHFLEVAGSRLLVSFAARQINPIALEAPCKTALPPNSRASIASSTPAL
jgi:hypothetical protein